MGTPSFCQRIYRILPWEPLKASMFFCSICVQKRVPRPAWSGVLKILPVFSYYHFTASNRKAAIRRRPSFPFLFLLCSRKFSITIPAKDSIHLFVAVSTLDIAKVNNVIVCIHRLGNSRMNEQLAGNGNLDEWILWNTRLISFRIILYRNILYQLFLKIYARISNYKGSKALVRRGSR